VAAGDPLVAKPLTPPPEAQRPPFARILCGVDGSRSSDAAVERALALAGGDASVQLLAVTDIRGSGANRMGGLDASLVVLGSRGLGGIRALRSVSERVGARAPCSVLVLRGEPPRHAA
jgi:nucleotide-binding universal stress UspA family protein